MGLLNNMLIVSLTTFISRVLGLLRDVMMTKELGTSFIHSAFISAFTLPNLFRRLLGEGALTSALIPVFSDEFHENGLQSAFLLLNKVITWMVLILVTLIFFGIGLIFFLSKIEGLEDRWYYVFDFSIILLPYMIFVCLAAVFSAVLNVLDRYFLSSMSAIWLNMSMIVFLGLFGVKFSSSQIEEVYWLIAGVIVGGVIQLTVPVVQLYNIGWRPSISLWITPQFRKLKELFMPGLIGASIMQINIAVSRLLAFNISPGAVSILYLANRLIELPLGVFVVTITTVIFPNLSKLASEGDYSQLAASFRRGVNMIITVIVPAAVGLLALKNEILIFLFEWGSFGRKDVMDVAPVLSILAISMPFYSLSTFFTRSFHSMKNTKTPVWISLINFVVNIVSTLLFMKPFDVVGVALANILSAVIQTILLYIFLVKTNSAFRLKGLFVSLFCIICSSGFMYIGALFCRSFFRLIIDSDKLYALTAIISGTLGGIIVYFFYLYMLGHNEIFNKIRYLVVQKLHKNYK